MSFETAQSEWLRLPVDDQGYFDARDLLALPEEEFKAMALRAEVSRYAGWRNYRGLWRRVLLDGVSHRRVLDFGCGLGLESLQFCRTRNSVVLADINASSVAVARRLLRLYGFDAESHLVGGEWPFVCCEPVDVFYSNGVLHHTPKLPEILKRASQLLRPGGEVRLMLYSDRGWRIATGSDPPAGDPRESADFERFRTFFDSVGAYSEPWWRGKLERVVEGHLEVRDWVYLTPDDRYAAARLVRAR